MSADHTDAVKQFQEVTGSDEQKSRQFLESTNWVLDEAVTKFFEQGGNIDEKMHVISDSSDMESPNSSPPPHRPKSQKKTRTGNIATLKSLEESDSDDEDREAFFAGGSERSGQQILGPPGKRDIVADMFRSVREHGGTEEDEERPSRSTTGFSGTGYKLGGSSDAPTEVVQTQSRSSRSQTRTVRLQLFREGFTVDDGPLRQYTDPNNATFLGYVRRGEVPPELASQGEVKVSLEDRRMEEYPKTKPIVRAFQGEGHMLGSPTPATVGATAPVAATIEDRSANERAAQLALGLDEQAPITSIQFRLADGTRLTGRFNHTHTISDLRQFIATAVPSYQLQTFTLLTSYPSRELVEPTETIEQAKLQNSVILQRCI